MLMAYLLVILSALYLIVVYMELDRLFFLNFSGYEDYVEAFNKKPLANSKYKTVTNVTLILECKTGLCSSTIKSLLDQSIKVNEIHIKTTNNEAFKSLQSLFPIILIKSPNDLSQLGGDISNIKINVENGKIYPYDYVENEVKKNISSVSNIYTSDTPKRKQVPVRTAFEFLFKNNLVR